MINIKECTKILLSSPVLLNLKSESQETYQQKNILLKPQIEKQLHIYSGEFANKGNSSWANFFFHCANERFPCQEKCFLPNSNKQSITCICWLFLKAKERCVPKSFWWRPKDRHAASLKLEAIFWKHGSLLDILYPSAAGLLVKKWFLCFRLHVKVIEGNKVVVSGAKSSLASMAWKCLYGESCPSFSPLEKHWFAEGQLSNLNFGLSTVGKGLALGWALALWSWGLTQEK